MPQTTKEWVLNYTMNRWGLNKKRNLGPTSDSIRICNPESKRDWSRYYYDNIRTSGQIDELGRSLYHHIITEIPREERFHPNLLSSITEEDCIAYMHYMAIDTPYDGYARERGLI